jgi:hypothetical protein
LWHASVIQVCIAMQNLYFGLCSWWPHLLQLLVAKLSFQQHSPL